MRNGISAADGKSESGAGSAVTAGAASPDGVEDADECEFIVGGDDVTGGDVAGGDVVGLSRPCKQAKPSHVTPALPEADHRRPSSQKLGMGGDTTRTSSDATRDRTFSICVVLAPSVVCALGPMSGAGFTLRLAFLSDALDLAGSTVCAIHIFSLYPSPKPITTAFSSATTGWRCSPVVARCNDAQSGRAAGLEGAASSLCVSVGVVVGSRHVEDA
jgi:hypothetical protein